MEVSFMRGAGVGGSRRGLGAGLGADEDRAGEVGHPGDAPIGVTLWRREAGGPTEAPDGEVEGEGSSGVDLGGPVVRERKEWLSAKGEGSGTPR